MGISEEDKGIKLGDECIDCSVSFPPANTHTSTQISIKTLLLGDGVFSEISRKLPVKPTVEALVPCLPENSL